MHTATRTGRPQRSLPKHDSVEIRFLDVSGRGVPDSVVTTTVIHLHEYDGRAVDATEVVESTASGIDLDGHPRRVTVRDTIFTGNPPGRGEILWSTSFELDPAELDDETLARFCGGHETSITT